MFFYTSCPSRYKQQLYAVDVSQVYFNKSKEKSEYIILFNIMMLFSNLNSKLNFFNSISFRTEMLLVHKSCMNNSGYWSRCNT